MVAIPAEGVLAAVSEERVVGLLRRLVDVPSPTGDERACAEALAEHLGGVGVLELQIGKAAVAALDAQHGDVRLVVQLHDLGVELAPVGERDADLGRPAALDDVGVGDDDPLGCGMSHVDTVIADAEVGDDFQLRKSVDPGGAEIAGDRRAANTLRGLLFDSRHVVAFNCNNLEAIGEFAALLPETSAALTLATPVAALTSRSVQAYFTGLLAETLGRRLVRTEELRRVQLSAVALAG